MKAPPPCFNMGNDCDKRHIGCRSECSEWTEWLAAHEAKREAIRQKKTAEQEADAFLAGQHKRILRGNQAKREREKRR